MSIPDVSREKIEGTLRAFDDHEREQCLDWENNRQHNYAILWQNQYYPVKQIIRMATGGEKFWGGRESNEYLSSRGFTIIELNPVRETDQRFRAALDRIQQANDLPNLHATAAYLMQHEWQEIQLRLDTFPKLGQAVCAASLDVSVIQTLAQNEIVGGHSSVRAQVKEFLSSDNAASLIEELIGGCRQPPTAKGIDRFVEAAVEAGFQDKSGSLARSNAALFASMLLTAVYPDRFVDFRRNRWANLAELFALEISPSGANYGELLGWAGRIAWELARTPTFNRYFSGEHPTWIVAGLAWLFQQEGEVKSLVIDGGSGKEVNQAMKIWKISAGRGGDKWPEFLGRKIIAIGTNKVITRDISSYDKFEDLQEMVSRLLVNTGEKSKYNAQQLWYFIHEMSIGDTVLAYGGGKFIGYGHIAGNYQYEASPDFPYHHQRNVDWNPDFEAIPRVALSDELRQKLGRQETIIPLSQSEFDEIMGARWNRKKIDKPISQLVSHFRTQGYHFSQTLLATFITALQTKGFVILSGLSGTGKTKLAQHMAGLLPNPEDVLPEADSTAVSEPGAIHIRVQPYMHKYARFIIPKAAYPLIEEPPQNSSSEVSVVFDGHVQTCLLSHANALALLLKDKVKAWFLENFEIGDTLIVTPTVTDDNEFNGFSLCRPTPQSSRELAANYIFVPVRPDWRDSKSLLGYYNPLTGEYDDTPFLRFVLRAQRHFEQEQDAALPHLVILDEMNLARIEYYFADFLSVIESGRDENGYSKEAIQLHSQNPEQTLTEGGLAIPRSLKLPPNLYIIGTVNMDETTHAFSPKVLDRAFTIEFNDVDFSNYPNPNLPASNDFDRLTLQRYLLDGFQRDGDFARIDKAEIAAFVQEHPGYRHQLQALKQLLVDHELHFGYRVFDEIMQYMAVAETGDLFDTLDDAFDQAVLMKVLPKFNGPRGRLSEPLQKVIGWAKEPHAAIPVSLKNQLQSTPACRQLLKDLEAEEFQYIETARKALRMLIRLHETGFASFA